jgi:Uma2 family endonuclease
MSALSLQPRRFTAEEYLMIERASEYRSEFLDGEIYAMSGASEPHITIVNNLSGEAYSQLKGTRCQGMSHDMKVAAGRGLYTYPDYLIVCGETRYLDVERDVLLNPTVICEVLSPSTQHYDRTLKFDRYKELDTLRDYVLIAQDSPRVEHYVRTKSGDWVQRVLIGLDASLTLTGATVSVSLADLYTRITFPASSQSSL